MPSDRSERLSRLAASMVVPERLTTAAARERFGEPDSLAPAVGQVRRAEWGEVSRLVLLLAAEDRGWLAAPLSIDPTGEDDASLIAEPGRTTFPVEVTAWAGLAAPIPTGVLSAVVDAWESDLVAWCKAMVSGDAGVVPSGARRGASCGPYDHSARVRAEVSDDVEALTQAPLVPVRGAVSVDLRAATVRVGLSTVVTALNIEQYKAMQIVQGKHPVTEEQARILADLFGIAAEDIMAVAGGVPLELARELEQPRWRATWKSMAKRMKISEAAARLQVGFNTAGLAYRQTGQATPDWAARIALYLATSESPNNYNI